MTKVFLILASTILLFSCTKNNRYSVKEYLAYVKDEKNGYVKERKFNGVSYNSTMLTPEMIVLRSGSENNSTKEGFEKELGIKKGKLNFILTIADEPGNNKVKEAVFNKKLYSQILGYSNAMMAEDFKLLHGKDTVYCSLLHLEPANSISPIFRITLAFDRISTDQFEDVTLMFNDNIFMNGPLKFYFKKELFTNKPEIIL